MKQRVVFSIIVLLMALALVLEFIIGLGPNAPRSLFAESIISKAVLCFSPYTNLKKIAKTVDANAVGQIGCLNGMRLVLITSIVLLLLII